MKKPGIKNSRAARSSALLCSVFLAILGLGGCSSLKSALAIHGSDAPPAPIHNPFGDFYGTSKEPNQNVILRTKKGDRSIEVELPKGNEMSDFVIPVSPAFKDSNRNPASLSEDQALDDESYKSKAPTVADREITRSFPQGELKDEGQRRDIETGLGLMPSEDTTPEATGSYLAAMDHLKNLYRKSRFEAALVTADGLIRQYPTDPKLYQMRGTLLDRLGQNELAVKSWNQALRLDPKNEGLRRFVERRQPASAPATKRSVASP
jgi:tetratricopeptide (TPR) repeat protein